MSNVIPIGFLLIICFLLGLFIASSSLYSKQTIIEHKCAYYHPETGKFTWLDEKIKNE